MPSWIRVVTAVAALPFLLIGASYAQTRDTQPGSMSSGGRTYDCYDRLPTELINLALRDASTQNTLRVLAQNYRVNLVVTDDVTGTVTLDFYRAPVRDVFQAILDSNGLVCVKQGELLRVSTSERIIKDEKGRADAQVSSAARDADISKRVNLAQREAADAAIQLAATQLDQKNAEIQARRGDIKQEIIRLKYQDPGIVARSVLAIAGINPNFQVAPCRLKKPDDKLNVEALDASGGGGTSAAVEAEKSLINLNASRGAFGGVGVTGAPYGSQPAIAPPGTAPGVTGPPGGLGALPPFSALFGPQPAPPAAAPAPPDIGGGLGGYGRALVGESSPTVRTDCSANALILRLYDEQMKRAKEAIETQLDVMPPQVKIESRLELLDRSDLFALGVQWGGGGLLGINNRTAVVGRGFTSSQDNTQGIPTSGTSTPPIPNASLANVIPVLGTTGLAAGGNLVNLPIANLLEGSAAGGGGGFAFGIISSRMDLNLALEALRTQDRSQSLARPEVVVAENQTAGVSIGEEIPYATVSSAGTQIQFKNALLRLAVSPMVLCRDDALAGTRSGDTHRIRLQVIVENATRGLPVDLGSVLGSPPAINTQKAATDTVVTEGQRLVIGGITQLTTRDQVRKVPLFGDIPVLGWLFKQKGEQNAKRELVVFLTPTVLVQEAPRSPPRCPVQVPTAAKAN
jgi:type II secretory pathway component HofQ